MPDSRMAGTARQRLRALATQPRRFAVGGVVQPGTDWAAAAYAYLADPHRGTPAAMPGYKLGGVVKKTKQKLGDLLPDEVEDLVAQAKAYLSDPVRVAGDVGRRAMHTRFLGAASPADVRRVYGEITEHAADPIREVAFTAVQKRFNPEETASTLRRRSEEHGGLGAAFRARENTLAKRVTENVLDPLNVIPVGASAGMAARGARAAGQSTARATLKALAKGGAREFAAPAAGQVAGAEAGRRIGGERGQQVGELAGLLAGGIGPNLVGNTPLPSLSRATEIAGTTAGAAGGYQATEDQDLLTRALATAGGAVAGYGLGRQVARGGPLGMSIEDVGRAADDAGAVQGQLLDAPGTLPAAEGPADFVRVLPERRPRTPITGEAEPLRDARREGQQAFPGLDPKAERRGILQIARSAVDLGQQAMLSGDISQVGRIGVIGGLQAASAGKPGAALTGFGRALAAAFNTNYAKSYLQSDKARRWADLSYPAQGVQPEFTGLIARVPVLGQLERAMFQRFTPVLAAEISEAILSGMRREVVRDGATVVKGRGDLARMSRAEAMQTVGQWVRQGLIGKELDPERMSAVERALWRFSLISPRWTRGQIGMVNALRDPGPQGELARRFWTTTIFLALASSVGITAAAEGKDPRDLLNPFHPDSVVDPRKGRNFLRIGLGERFGNVTVSPFQPIMPLVRTLLRPVVEGAQATTDAHDVGAAVMDGDVRELLAAVGTFVMAAGGEARQAARDYLMGRTSPPIRLFDDLVVREADFSGNPIVTKEGPAGLLQAGRYIASQVAPIGVQPFVEQTKRIPGTEPTARDRAVEFASNFIGLQVRTPDRLPGEVAGALRSEIAARGVTPAGNDAELFRQFAALNLDADEKSRFYHDNPAVRAYLDDRTRLQGEKFEKPQGRAAIQKYDTERQILQDARRQALIELERENLPGSEYRRRRAEIQNRYRERLAQTEMMIFGSDDPARVQAARDAVYRSDREDGPVRKALDGLYAIEQEGPSREQREAFFQAREEYLASLPADIRERMLQKQLADAPTESERQYIQAQQRYGEWNRRYPRYRGIRDEDADTALPYMQQAADLQRVRPGMSFRAALLRVGAPARERRTALKIRSGKYTNQARRRAFARDPLLARWYTELNAKLADELAGG
jgi:hypothetical protein